MPSNNSQINIGVKYNVDQASVNAVKKSLQDLQNIKIQDFKGPEQDLRQIQKRAKQVQSALQKAFNVNLNTVNVDKFYSELGLVDRNLNNIYNDFAKAGNQGRAAFNGVASALVTTNTQLRQSSSLLQSMGTTMMNTVKWGVASSVMNTFTNSVREAFQYVKSLDSALTDIRIVTGDSRQQMANFAAQANKAAQSLGRSTMDYTKAALTFYQQGLSEADVQARTESVLKAQNITGAGQEMADYLTAVWNGYKVANEEAELYVDKLAAVADSSASNMSQLAIAMSKVASSANLLGVPVDNLNAQIATIVATTRQAPQSVGNALKTIYSRINDIATGADDAQISLGNYSAKMAQVGVNVLDANGRLRDTGDVIDEIGGKWETLSHEQQIYLARTMAGQRQYNNLLALFENWGKYTDLVNVSLNSQGTTMEKNSRYMQSLEAHLEQLGAASQRLKSSMIDSDSFKGFIDFGTKGVQLLANLIESIGGGGNALLGLGSIATQVFSGIISKQISNVIIKAQQNKQIYEDMRAKMAQTQNQKTSAAYLDSQNTAYKEYINNLSQVHKSWIVLSQDERQAQQNRLQRIRTLSEEKKQYTDNITKVEQYRQALSRPGATRVIETDVKNGLQRINQALQQSGKAVEKFVDNFGSSTQNVGLEYLQRNIKSIQEAFHGADINGSQKLIQDIQKLRHEGQASGITFDSLYDRINQFYTATGKDIQLIPIIDKLRKGLQLTQQDLDKLNAKFGQVNKDAQTAFNTQQIVKFVGGIGQVASGINGLVNITKVWKNESLSAGEKLLQTFTGLSMSIGMLYSGFKSILPVVGTLFSTVTVGTSGATVGTIAQTAATKGLSVALAQAGVSAGALMTALWPLFVVGGVVAGIVATVAAVDHFTMSVKEADQAIEAFNEKQKQMANSNATLHEQTSTLKSIKSQYEQLAEKAGAINFDATIDNLTQAERNRYNQLKEIISQYNEDTIAGYDAQGKVILQNNTNLEQQIKILQRKRQAQIDAYVASQDYQNAKKAYGVKADQAQKDTEDFQIQKPGYEEYYKNQIAQLRNQIDQYSLESDEVNTALREYLDQLGKKELKDIQQDRQFFDQFKNYVSNLQNETTIKRGLTDFISSIDKIPNFEVEQTRLKDLAEQASKIPINIILTELQASANNSQYKQLAQVYGQAMINSLIQNYVEGLNLEDYDDIDQVVKQIREQFLQSLSAVKITEDDLKNITGQISKLNNIDFSNALPNQYSEYITQLINKILQQNQKIKELAKNDSSVFSQLIQSLFGLEGFEGYIDQNGKLIVKKIETKFTQLRKEVQQKAKNLDPIELDIPWNILSSDTQDQFTKSLREWIANADIYQLQHFDEILKTADIDVNNLGKSLDDATVKVKNLANVSSAAETLNLLNLKTSGETLDDTQLSTMYNGLNQLATLYPEIINSVQVLNKEWLEGTSIYQRALQDVKNSVFDSFSTIGQYTDDILAKMSSLILTTEDLQNAITQNNGIFSTEGGQQWYAQQLERIASNYESCTDELNKYIFARQNGNKIEEKAAKFNLQLAARSEQNSQLYDIQAERISQVAKRFVEYAEAGEEGYQGLDKNAQLAADAATKYLKLNDAVADLSDNFDNYKQVLEEARNYGIESVRASQDMNETFSNLKESVAGLLDTSSDLFGDDWVVQNMENILQAAQGNEEALKELQQTAAEEILINLGVDTSSLGMTTQEVADWANNLPEGQLSLDDTVFLNQLVWAMQQAGMAQTDIEDALSGLNLQVDLAPYEAGLNDAIDAAYQASDAIVSNLGFNAQTTTDTKTDQDTVEIAGYDATPVPMTAPVALPRIAMQQTPFGIIPTFAGVERGTISFSGISVTPNKEPIDTKKQTSATALMVKNARHSSGGKISHSNKTSPGRKSGGGGGGGGGSKPKAASVKSITNAAKVDTTVKKTTIKAPTPEKLDDTKIKEKQIEETIQFQKTEELELLEVEEERADVYHDINIQLDKSEKHLNNLKDKEEKLIPRDRLKLLEEENKAYEEQNKLYEEKIDIANNEQDRIQKELADLNAGVQFGEDGFVSNYAQVYNKLNQQVNDATEEANKKRQKLYNDYNEKIAKKNAQLLNANNADQLAQNKLTNAYRAAQKTYNDAVTNYNNRNSSLADAAQRDIEGYEAAAEAQKQAANKIFLAAQDRHQGVLRDYNSLTGDQQENYKAILQQEDDLFKNAQTTLSDTLKDIDRNLDKQVEARKKTLQNQQNDLKSVLDQAEQVWSDAEDKYKDDSDKINQRKKDRQKQYKQWEKQLNKEYEKQLKAIEKQLGDQQDRRKNIIDLMKQAEETQNLILELQQKERANDQAKIDNLIAQSKFRVDMSIDTGNFEREFLDFEKKFIKKIAGDDFLGSAKASMKDLMSYINSEQVSLTADQIKMIQEQIDSIQKTGTSSKYGDRLTEAKADLEQYMRQQMSDLQAIQEQVDNIKNSYLSAIDNAKNKMDDQINQYERINGLVDHQVKMTQLLYGDKAYDILDKYYNLQKRNNQDQLNSLKRQQDYWQQKMNQQVVGSDAWEKFKSNLDDVTDKLNSKLQVMIDNLSKQWSNRVDGIIARFNNGMTGGRGLNYLDEQWDQINNYDNQFLDTFESKTGIDEVERLYQSTIDGLTGSPKSQQALNKLMNDQLKLLREKDHLTEYDLERAKASLEVEKARLALEEARDNKTKMRLRRDSQGNYTYQYVADEEKLGDLQAALADAQANLYNTDKEHYKQNLNELYSTYKNYLDQMRSLTEEYNKTQDEEERKRIQGRMDLLKTSTNKLMNGLTQDNKYLLQYLNGSFFDGMGVDTSALTMEEQMEIMQQNIPQMQSGIQDLADTIVGEGGILNATADAMKEINEATSEYDKNVKDMLASAGTSLQTIEQAIDKEGNALDKNIQNAEAFITTNQKLIDECNAQIEAMEKMLDYMDKYLNKVINVQTLVSNLRSAYGTVQGLNGSDLTADKIATEGWGLDTTKGMEYTGNPAIDAAAVKQQIDALMAQYQTFLAQMSIAAFETGGYTGTWGDAEGRLAFLHQGELVLNQQDTSNILSAVQLVRNMANAINGFASGEINSLMSGATGLLGGINNTEQLDQNVHIEANFPNVTQHTEIEQAFENLVNMASMRASKYRD